MKELYDDVISKTRVVKAITNYILLHCIDLKKMKEKERSINEFKEIVENFSNDLADEALAKKILNFILCENIKLMEKIDVYDFISEEFEKFEDEDYYLREYNDEIPSFSMIIFNYIAFSRKLDKKFIYCLDAFLYEYSYIRKLSNLSDYIEIHKELQEEHKITVDEDLFVGMVKDLENFCNWIQEKNKIISELKRENESNIDKLKKLSARNKSLMSNLKDSKEEYKELEKEFKTMENDIIIMNSRRDDLVNEILFLKKENNALLMNCTADDKDLIYSYLKAEDTIEKLRKRNRNLLEENEKLKIEIEKMQLMQDDIITDLKKEEDDKKPELYAGEKIVILGGKWNDINKNEVLEYYDADFIVAEDIKRYQDKIKNYDYVLFDTSRNSHGNFYLVQKIKPSYRLIEMSNRLSVDRWFK